MENVQAHPPERIDNLFSTPAARADRWRDLTALAAGWANGQAERADVEAFQSVLRSGGYSAFIRRTLGDDIDAACGQLALQGAAYRDVDRAQGASNCDVAFDRGHDPYLVFPH